MRKTGAVWACGSARNTAEQGIWIGKDSLWLEEGGMRQKGSCQSLGHQGHSLDLMLTGVWRREDLLLRVSIDA